MSGLHVPLSTLRWQPRGSPCMTRGQDGSLLPSCVTLSFTTPRRFIPAHSAACYISTVCTQPSPDQVLCGVRDFPLPAPGDAIPNLGITEILQNATRVTVRLK